MPSWAAALIQSLLFCTACQGAAAGLSRSTSGAVASVTSQQLAARLLPATAAAAQAEITRVAHLTFAQYYAELSAGATDAVYVVDGVSFSGARSEIEARQADFIALGRQFATVGDFWQAARLHMQGAALGAADLSQAVRRLGASASQLALAPMGSASGAEVCESDANYFDTFLGSGSDEFWYALLGHDGPGFDPGAYEQDVTTAAHNIRATVGARMVAPVLNHFRTFLVTCLPELPVPAGAFDAVQSD